MELRRALRQGNCFKLSRWPNWLGLVAWRGPLSGGLSLTISHINVDWLNWPNTEAMRLVAQIDLPPNS